MPRHSTVVAYAALFVALGGTSYAAVNLKANSVSSREIRNESIRVADLAPSVRDQLVSRRQLARAVTEVIKDPTTGVVTVKVTGEKGDRGDTGSTGGQGGTGEQGPTGGQGEKGGKGDRGDTGGAWGMGRIPAAQASGSVSGITYTHPATGTYCLDPVLSTQAATVTPEGDGASDRIAFVVKSPSTGACAGHGWQVSLSNLSSVLVDHPFYVVVD